MLEAVRNGMFCTSVSVSLLAATTTFPLATHGAAPAELGFSATDMVVGCLPREQDALLAFKRGIKSDPLGLASHVMEARRQRPRLLPVERHQLQQPHWPCRQVSTQWRICGRAPRDPRFGS